MSATKLSPALLPFRKRYPFIHLAWALCGVVLFLLLINTGLAVVLSVTLVVVATLLTLGRANSEVTFDPSGTLTQGGNAVTSADVTGLYYVVLLPVGSRFGRLPTIAIYARPLDPRVTHAWSLGEPTIAVSTIGWDRRQRLALFGALREWAAGGSFRTDAKTAERLDALASSVAN